ncbi:oxygen-independent coproporphyrinogen III oxidase [Phyllobacterium phragmitis]|uniref:Coproporphyrinogen-III oxidase n=1 Tax=Phyllobacterium phragmitis TaxID=2670329 RepID=A0A2S9IN04_9HYPH|nr:oxygen-independent coproporphyrinogen III oxidase [Phyllobacterium phragmitis]PRD41862.1 oxygen-independent coproporphyrinogen III oxidase [Phyllobacterium phragmitis]
MSAHPAFRPNDTAPRYTSYPTAPHFHAGLGGRALKAWLGHLPDGEPVSLYVHIPFCDRLCWFCACHTKQTRHYAPVEAYLNVLHQEIAAIGRLVGDRANVGALHFGGGSPTMLKPADLAALDRALRSAFTFANDIRISVEIDPNDMDEARLDALAAMGMTRASLGIQDFHPRVQEAINREQSFETTHAVVEGLRKRGVRSVNLDLLYGLPYQTTETLVLTLRQALMMHPDRLALFGYAHVPWFKKHQTMIDEASLPGSAARLMQSQTARDHILAQGYAPIGIDHFARPGDGLALAAANGTLRRNFQGYTDDRCATLIGLGPSSVSQFPQGYLQNSTATGEYMRLIRAHGLATVRGIELTDDDRMRRWIIERLMCDFAFSAEVLRKHFGPMAEEAISCAMTTAADQGAGLCEWNAGIFSITPEGRPFTRAIAAKFDRYLARGTARHSAAV